MFSNNTLLKYVILNLVQNLVVLGILKRVQDDNCDQTSKMTGGDLVYLAGSVAGSTGVP